MQSRRIPIILIIVVLIIACLCTVGIGVLGYSFFSIRDAVVTTAPEFPEAIPVQPSTTSLPDDEGSPPDPEPTAVTTPEDALKPTEQSQVTGENIPPEVAASMDTIQEQVITIRGLEPEGSFTRAIFSPENLRERVVNDFFSDYTPEEAADDALILSFFGLLEPDFDLIALYIELFSEQVAGFYDDETREMVVVGSESFGGPEKLTYAHEYNHALQDQNFNFNDGLMYNDDACEVDSERCAAVQALIEGDATLLEIQWFLEYATDTDLEQIVAYYNSLDLTVLDNAPAFLQEDFVFPYDEGYLFVEYLFNAGGWAAVDAAFADPPVSTEQILHPEKYPNDAPAPVSLPDLLPILGSGWELIDDNVMGEWYTYLILAHGTDPGARLPDDQAAAAAAGWGGDRYVVYHNRVSGETVMVLKATWDTPEDTVEFAAAFSLYADDRFGPSSAAPSGTALWEADAGVHLFTETGGATIWVAAPDPTVAEVVLAAIDE